MECICYGDAVEEVDCVLQPYCKSWVKVSWNSENLHLKKANHFLNLFFFSKDFLPNGIVYFFFLLLTAILFHIRRIYAVKKKSYSIRMLKVRSLNNNIIESEMQKIRIGCKLGNFLPEYKFPSF